MSKFEIRRRSHTRWSLPLLVGILAGCDAGSGTLLEPQDGPELLWSVPVGAWAWGLETDGERLYVAGAGGLWAVDVEDGEDSWVYELLFTRAAPPEHGRSGDLVVVALWGQLAAIGAEDGAERWRRDDLSTDAMTVTDDHVYLSEEGADAAVTAVDPPSGEVRWRMSTPGTGATQLAADGSGVCVRRHPIVVVTCHLAADGRVAWSVVVDGVAGDGEMVLAGGRLVTTVRDNQWVALDRASGQEVWRRSGLGSIAPGQDGLLYTCGSNECVAVGAESGTEIWRTSVPSGPIGVGGPWLLVNGGTILSILNGPTGGLAGALEPSPEWWPFQQRAAVSGDRLFVMTSDVIQAYRLPGSSR